MPRLARWIITPLALAIAFVLGAFVGAHRGWLQPVVLVTIVNQTGVPISELELAYTSSGSSGSVKLPRLEHQSRAVARFYLSGEGSYKVSAKLQDGTVISEQEAYVESGYVMTEVLVKGGSTSSMQYRGDGG